MPEKDVTFWMWIAGFFGTSWLGFVTLAHRSQNKRIDDNATDIKKCADDHVPRSEWKLGQDAIIRELTGVSQWLESMDKKMSERRKGD